MTGKRHMLRLAAPKSWPIKRKERAFITKTSPGPHSLESSLPLIVVLRDILNYTKTKKETKFILNTKEVLINKVARKDLGFPVGIFDIIEIPKLEEQFLVLFNHIGKITFEKIKKEDTKIKKEDTKIKISKIIGKTTLKGKKTQINLFDGNNYILDKDNYKVGDSLVIDLDSKKIKTHLPLEKGCIVYLIGGSHIGQIGKVKEIINKKNLQKPTIIYELNGEEHMTLKDYAFVIGKEKSLISIKK